VLGNGYLNTFPSVKQSTRIDVRCWTAGSAAMELNTFPAQRIHKQQKRNPLRGDFYTVRGRLQKEDSRWRTSFVRERITFVLEKRIRFLREIIRCVIESN
jgi:hypothetical protein